MTAHLRRLLAAGLILAAASPALAGEYRVIHTFAGGAEGGDPAGPLASDPNGDLYGITNGGGDGNGVVFRLSGFGLSPWKETVLYTVPARPAGVPLAPGLTLDRDGALYGSATFGGAAAAGTVFRLAPPTHGATWAYQTLHAFAGTNSRAGAYPSGRLLLDARGDVFGTTQGGGAVAGRSPCVCGVAYRLSPPAGSGPWTETVLHAFANPPDGGLPDGGLTPGPDGTLFGTTGQGGTGACLDGSSVYVIGCGAIYQLGANQGVWSESVLFSFRANQENGPFDILTPGPDGALYGVAGLDVYRLRPPTVPGGAWRQQVLYEFPGGITGIAPAGGVVFDRFGLNLYGVTRSFGLEGVPTLYRLAPAATSDAPWLETTLRTFRAATGFSEQPYGALLRGHDGTFYGTVGAGNGQFGYVFAYRP